MARMSSQTVLISGASAGIGAATARLLATGGHQLILLARRPDKLDALAHELSSLTTVHTISADVRDSAAVRAALTKLPAFDTLTVLINNAGLALGLDKAQDASTDDWDVMIDTNIRALTHLTRLVLPGFVARKRGHIVNLGSVAGSYPYPGGNVYGATKAFVERFSLNLRADLHGTGVRVTNIEPGMVETDFSAVRFRGDDARAAEVYRGAHPLTADDIAESIRWCIELPERVNINRLELMPTTQSFGPFPISRT